MKLTITAEAPVPYTTLLVGSSLEVHGDLAPPAIELVAVRLIRDVEVKVDEELKRLGIKLGPDGFRIN